MKALEFPDGTTWVYTEGLDLWTGWDDEPGCWYYSDENFRKLYDVSEGVEVEDG